ncbi:MAG: amino acid permease [Caulobacteraceae bacterium]|nr:amino acid permease [Caulobacteraceae bacterium]
MSAGRPPGPRLFIKKSIDQVMREASSHSLKRTLGPINLVLFGIGCIIGAGIYVMTGNAAATYAGPAVMLSFVVAGIACAFAGLCYAELASTMPVAGSAYTYAYTTQGELMAWTMGWLLVLEYGIAASTVAAGWSGNVISLLHQYGVDIPAQFSTSYIQAIPDANGVLTFSGGHGLNLVAAAGILAVTLLLVVGVSESATVNNIVVFIKVGVLLAFIGMGVAYINVDNYTPFIPENTGNFGTYGVSGIFRAASVIFFAYVGFEAVSTAAAEAKNPQRDMPIGILGSLFVCTLIYMAVAAVLTGIVPYKELGVPAPIALATDRMGVEWFAVAIKVGAIAGLTSVMLILTYGQTRVFYAMARDGLLPKAFAKLHTKFRTPWVGTLILGILIAVVASLLPIQILGDMVSLGTAVAFAIVCISVMSLRKSRPDLPRPFRAPWGSVTPILGVVFAIVMIAPLVIDIYNKAMKGDTIPAMLLGSYIAIGALIYLFYGLWNSRLAKGLDVLEDTTMTTPLQAGAHGLEDPKS